MKNAKESVLPTPQPYPVYKPSTVEWLGNVPAHWEVRRTKHWVEMNHRVLPETTAPEYRFKYIDIGSVGTGILLERPREMPFGTAPSRARRVVQKGDTIVSTVRTYLKAVLFIDSGDDHLVCSTGFAVLTPKHGTSPKFVSYLVQCNSFTDRVTANSTGTAYPAISESQLGSFHIALPPLPEQRAIVRFLDHVDDRIRRYVSAKEKLIALLEEERQAVIHRAVTRGLDPNAPLKPSGVQWLGDVPAHWEVMPVKRAFLSMDYGISESASDSGTIRILTMGHLRDGRVVVPPGGGVDSVSLSLLLEKGDLLFNRTNSQELVGKVGLFVGHESPVTFASYLVRLRPRPNHEPEFLNMALNDTSFLSRSRREAIPSLHQSNLNPTRYGRLHIALPSKEEQQSILLALRQKIANIDAAITRARRQIELLREYRTRLIADVVTGKLDVRETAANLPEEARQ